MALRWGFSRAPEAQADDASHSPSGVRKNKAKAKLQAAQALASPFAATASIASARSPSPPSRPQTPGGGGVNASAVETSLKKEIASLSTRIGLLNAGDCTRKLQISELEGRSQAAMSTVEAYGLRLSALEETLVGRKESGGSSVSTGAPPETSSPADLPAKISAVAGPMVAVAVARLAAELRMTLSASIITLRSEFDEKFEALHRVLLNAQQLSPEDTGYGHREHIHSHGFSTPSTTAPSYVVAQEQIRKALWTQAANVSSRDRSSFASSSRASTAAETAGNNLLGPALRHSSDGDDVFAEDRLSAATEVICREMHSRDEGLSRDENGARYVMGSADSPAPRSSQRWV